ncbi:hypothetical protein GH714_023559 [Hevea brasiliensis]|uniref:Uncharacterized protein n=1 Tax=Hevea brasiliensis TaxID=3981 RepID=A0A6A6N1M9_HEVBR|nr:hypothetical protein GH714_023559 [Hevea brasiliensis]
MDPFSIAVIGAGIGALATLAAAVPPAATFIYNAAKDSLTSIDYIRKLDHNREKLEKELEELIAFANDIDQGRVKKEELKNTSIYKVWRTRLSEIEAEVKASTREHERIKEKPGKKFYGDKRKLGKQMVNKLEEVTKHIEKGIGAVATLTAAVPPAATFIYDAAKDSLTSIDYIRKLDHNREKLEKELEELIAFANDIDQGRVKKEEIKILAFTRYGEPGYRRLKQK